MGPRKFFPNPPPLYHNVFFSAALTLRKKYFFHIFNPQVKFFPRLRREVEISLRCAYAAEIPRAQWRSEKKTLKKVLSEPDVILKWDVASY